MWLFVMFDLPVGTKKERKQATTFRNSLLDLGFEMSQFSVYIKYCRTVEKSESVSNQLKRYIPPGGKIDVLTITDKQFSNIRRFYGENNKKNVKDRKQLLLF